MSNHEPEEPTAFDEPSKEPRSTAILLKTTAAEADKIDGLAEQMGMNRSRFLRYRALLPVGPVPIGGSSALERAHAALGEALAVAEELLEDAGTSPVTRRARRALEGLRPLYDGTTPFAEPRVELDPEKLVKIAPYLYADPTAKGAVRPAMYLESWTQKRPESEDRRLHQFLIFRPHGWSNASLGDEDVRELLTVGAGYVESPEEGASE